MKFYQQFSSYYDHIFPLKKQKLNFIKDNIVKQGPILDLATGTGSYAIALAEEGYQVKGLDLSPRMISIAKNKAYEADVKVDFRAEDMKRIDQIYQGDNFSLISCIGNSLVHLDNEDEIKQVLRKIYKLLQSGGRLLIQIVNYDRIINKDIDSLPSIKGQNGLIKLIRDYEFIEDKVKFKTKLITLRGEFKNHVLLHPLQSDKLREILKGVGFRKIDFYEDFNYSRYAPLRSMSLVAIVEK